MHFTKSERIVAENLALLYGIAAERYGDLPAFATREKALQWRPVSFREIFRQGLNLATGLIDLGVRARDHVGLFGDNRYEWMLADYGVQLCGAADVPRGRDVSDSELRYIVEHAGITTSFAETAELASRLLRLQAQVPALRQIILLDPNAEAPAGVLHLQDVCRRGEALREKGDRRAEDRIAGIRPDDLFTLIYTSGTTGTPKGVMLTHENMVSQIRNLPGHHNCTDRILSVLPIWHVFERVIEMYTISFGGCTYYSSIHTLSDDMKNVEPTFMASAPRLWEKIHEKILTGVRRSHPVRQVLFHIAYFLSKQYKNSEYFLTNKDLRLKHRPLWLTVLLAPLHVLRWLVVLPWYGFFNAAVLERVRLGAGGSLAATISGGGALPIHIDRFFNYVGIPVLEGYGLTETSPVISVRSRLNLVVGTVGPPINDTEVRITCPDTGAVLYPDPEHAGYGRGRRGEIWVRGPQVMKGYYREPELTAQAVQDGWLRTGDLGMITHNDCLKILGRSKATIVLSSGENVEPEPLEMQLQQSRYIDQCMVVGQDQKFLGLLVVPELTAFGNNGSSPKSPSELTAHPEAEALIRKEIRRMISPSSGYKRYEHIHDFRILPEKFEIGRELTNLFKIKRHVVAEKYRHIIDELFATSSSTTKK
ncbi:MAG: long-chain fatty acid--CoA ligase [Bacteroidales bacterium]|nr:long-chain fatty acid--CoA ligase [Bacteroidales bacterium]